MTDQVSVRSRAASISPQKRTKSIRQAADDAVAEVERLGTPFEGDSLEKVWHRFSPQGAIEVLSAMIKADMKIRFERGERPRVVEYLERFESLRNDRERVVSLVYEEFCLREERGERPNPDSFCDQYEPWRDSLLSQLRYHDVFSQVAGLPGLIRHLPTTGDRFLNYRLGPILGEGGSARVFLANDESVGDRLIALKVSSDRGKESSINGQLDHGHIVPVLSVRDDPETGLRGLAMPYWPGLSLEEVIRRVDPASRPKRAEVLRQVLGKQSSLDGVETSKSLGWIGFPENGAYVEGVAWIVAIITQAVAHAHSRGIFHRDIKPANVLLTARAGPQLLDFNLSHDPHAVDRAEAALRGGTLPYMAPEQLAAFLDPADWSGVGTEADIYSLGLLLRELLTGERPKLPSPSTPAPRAIRELIDRRELGFAPTRDSNANIPYALDAILQKCLAFRPQDRYSSARALANDLQRFVDRRPLIEAVNKSNREKLKNWADRNRVGRVAMVVIPICTLAMILLRLGLGFVPAKTADDYMRLATSSIQSKNWLQGRDAADQAIKLNPKHVKAYQARSKIATEIETTQIALGFAQKALEITLNRRVIVPEELGLLWLNLGALNMRNGTFTEAKEAYLQSLKYIKDYYRAYAGLAWIADAEARYADAIDYFRKAIRVASTSTRSFEPNTISYFYLDCGRAEVHLAQTRQGSRSPKDQASAASLFESALKDIQLAWKLLEKPTDAQKALFSSAEEESVLGIADMNAARENFGAAVEGYKSARGLLEQAIKAKGLDADIRNRLDLIEKRLHGACNRLAQEWLLDGVSGMEL